MRKWIFLLLFFVITLPLVVQAGVPGFMKERMGTLSGQVVSEDGKSVPGGVVSFFNASKGIPPLVSNMHRIPDMVGKLGQDGKFTVQLLPGAYYMGALIITDPGRGPGPPREGETFYFARDEKGNLREFTLATKEVKDAGRIVGALPDTFPLAKNLVIIEGKLVVEDGQPFEGGVVLVKTDMNNARPDFVSGRTGPDGKFTLRLPADTSYYLLGRERAVGRPMPGTYVGTYGSISPITEGGALPIGNVRPAQPASGMPQIEGKNIGPGDDLPTTLMGKAGETISDIEIMMFRMPVPGEQREKLQGTLGFNDEFKEKMDEAVPVEPVEPGTAKEK
jgi:hypothetical protein